MTRTMLPYPEMLVTARTGRDVPDLLRELYIERRHSQDEIALALGVTRGLVNKWLRTYGIRRADRSPVVIEAP